MISVETINYNTLPKCPICGNLLKYKDSKKRRILDYGREESHVYIRRLWCESCQKMHNEFPKSVVPYRHYRREVITDVVDEIVNEDDFIAENGPANITMRRWKSFYKKGDLNC